MKSIASFLASVTLALSLSATTQAAELKIGYVNTERLFRDSAIAVKASKKLEKEFQPREQEVQKMIKQARDLQTSLEKDGLTMAEADRVKKQRELANLGRELQQAQREFREDVNKRRNEELNVVQERARKAIIELAEKEKYDLILENVIYANPAKVDITDRVLKALER